MCAGLDSYSIYPFGFVRKRVQGSQFAPWNDETDAPQRSFKVLACGPQIRYDRCSSRRERTDSRPMKDDPEV